MKLIRQGQMKRLLLLLAAAGMAWSTAQSGIGDWKNFTAMNSVRGVASSHDSVWAATSGGAFLYTLGDSSFFRVTNSEGLTTNDLTAVVIDRYGAVWFGQSDGSIDVYTPATGRWRYIRDIAVADKVQKSVTCFYAAGDSMYIGTSFGVSLFSIPRFEFIDTYSNFGTTVPPPVLSVVAWKGRVFAATATGIAASIIGAANLAAPESWESVTVTGAVSTLALFNGTVLAGGDAGLFSYSNASWVSVPAASAPVRFTGQSAAALFFTREDKIFSYAPGGAVTQLGTQLPSNVTGGTNVGGAPILGTNTVGIAVWNPTSGLWMEKYPNGPAANSIVSIAIDNNGDVWGASGRSFGSGFYKYDGDRWTNYSMANVPGMKTNDAYGVAIGPNNSKWISTWGGGLILVNGEGKVVRSFDDDSPGFTGVEENIHFVVSGIAAKSSDGSVWTTSYNSANDGKVVWKMNVDSSWVAYASAPGPYKKMLGVTIDRNDTKWFINQLPGFPADARLVFLNEKIPAIAGTSDGWGEITTDQGATSSKVTSVIEDRDGQLWIGTSVGITTILDPLRPLKTISKVYLGAVRDQYINCITVDALNQKWVGTSKGVFVLSADGTALVTQYTVANSNGKLVSDNVIAIAFDVKKGIAYFGTEKGLSSVGILQIEPSADYSTIFAYPNPFRIPDHQQVYIQGLAEGSTIKILTVSGKLVKQIAADGGGRASWNGTTDSGEFVASGIYLAAAYNASGSQVGTVKLAVIRR